MTRDEVLSILRAHSDELRERHVKSLALFGSVARDEAGPESDVDLLVEFDGTPVGYYGLIRLETYLASLLDRPVDLGTFDSLRTDARDDVARDLIHVS